MADIKVRAFLQRTAGSCKVRLWLLSSQRSDIAWFKDMDFSQAVRRERSEQPEGRAWGSFEASFFGPDFQAVEAMSRVYDERTLNQEFTRAFLPPPAIQALQQESSTGSPLG
jgi:hypothetical protein